MSTWYTSVGQIATDIPFLFDYRKRTLGKSKEAAVELQNIHKCSKKNKDVTKNMFSPLFSKIFNTILTRIYQSGT